MERILLHLDLFLTMTVGSGGYHFFLHACEMLGRREEGILMILMMLLACEKSKCVESERESE